MVELRSRDGGHWSPKQYSVSSSDDHHDEQDEDNMMHHEHQTYSDHEIDSAGNDFDYS